MRDVQPQFDADVQRKVARKIRTALDRTVAEVSTFKGRLAQRLTGLDAEHDKSPFARQAPRDDGQPSSPARAVIWHEGLRELKIRLGVGLDAARSLRALCLQDAGLVLAPLVVARPALEAAVDVRVYIGGRPNDDRVARFFAGMIRDMQRVGDPLAWKSERSGDEPDALGRARAHWGELLELAPQAGLQLEVDPVAPHTLGARVLRVQGRGKACTVETNISSLLGSRDRDLLQAWRMTSGAVHGASWMAGDQFGQMARGESLGFAWITGARVVSQSLGWMCDELARFVGLDAGYERRFVEALMPAHDIAVKAVADNPHLAVAAIFGLGGADSGDVARRR